MDKVYTVKEIRLLSTIFLDSSACLVQAPNTVLNDNVSDYRSHFTASLTTGLVIVHLQHAAQPSDVRAVHFRRLI